MPIERHNLVKELPEFKEQIHDLKTNDKQFSHLFDKYHELDNQVFRIEEGEEDSSEEFLDNLKKQRLSLKDQLFTMLKAI